MDDELYDYCDSCGESFDNAFEYVDHFIEEDEEEFNPALVMPNGVRLLVGSLLRFIYENADTPDEIRQITQSTYVTLFAAETDFPGLEEMIEDVVVENEMMKFDDALRHLLEKGNDDDESRA